MYTCCTSPNHPLILTSSYFALPCDLSENPRHAGGGSRCHSLLQMENDETFKMRGLLEAHLQLVSNTVTSFWFLVSLLNHTFPVMI